MPCLAWPGLFPCPPSLHSLPFCTCNDPTSGFTLCAPSLHQALSFRPVFIQFVTSPVRRTKRNAQLYATFLLLATVDTVDSGTSIQTYSGTVWTTLDNCQSRVDIVTAFGPLFILFSLSLSLSPCLWAHSVCRCSLFLLLSRLHAFSFSLLFFSVLFFWLLVNTQIKLYAWILFQPPETQVKSPKTATGQVGTTKKNETPKQQSCQSHEN